MERLDQQMRFVGEIDRLKGVLRQTMLAGPGRRENSAEHSWHLAMMAVTLGEHAPPGTDIGRVTAMLLLHDLVEIDAGDLFVYADDAQQAKQEEAEHAAADRIFALLPGAKLGPKQGTRLYLRSSLGPSVSRAVYRNKRRLACSVAVPRRSRNTRAAK